MALARALRRLRGTAFDPFGYSAERRTERRLIGAYEEVIEELLAGLGLDNHELAVEIARIPEQIRGYGHVKERHLRARAAARGRAAGGLPRAGRAADRGRMKRRRAAPAAGAARPAAPPRR